MLVPLPVLVTFTLDMGAFSSVSGTRVRLQAYIVLPGSMSSQHAVRRAEASRVGPLSHRTGAMLDSAAKFGESMFHALRRTNGREAGAVRRPRPGASAAQSTLPKMIISFSVSQ
jgi:hypothetical protein